MDIHQMLKAAFLSSMLLYGGIAFMIAGPPVWERGWLPDGSPGNILVPVLFATAIGMWAAGLAIGRKAAPPAAFPSQSDIQWDRMRLVLAAALIEGGALFGLVLSIVLKDSRYAIAGSFAGIAALVCVPARASGAS